MHKINSERLQSFFRRYWILLGFVLLKLILQFILVNPIYELHRDEFLHLDQSFHPAFGYISVPPFTSWMGSLIYLMGGGLLWIRLIPAIFGAATVVFGWLIAEELGGNLPAKILTSTLLIFSVYARLNVLFQPNSFDILAWTIIFYLLIKYLKAYQDNWLFFLSLITVLGLYNKYTIVFLIIGLAIGLLFTEHRRIYHKKVLYYALCLSLLLFLPNILWQITHHFPVIHHMRALAESQLVHVNRLDFLFDQIKFGVVGIPFFVALWALIFYQPFKPYRFVLWAFAIIMLLFTISRAKSYYTLGLYPVLFAFGSVYLEVLFNKHKVIFISILVAVKILVFFFIVKYLMPFQTPPDIQANAAAYETLGLLRWEDGVNHHLPQDFADMLGWKEMADKTVLAYNMIPGDELKNTLIFCENYGQTGALNYYNRNKTSQAYSFSTDYIYWLPENLQIRNMVYVGEPPGEDILRMFDDYRTVGVVENEFARERGTTIFLLLGARDDTSEIFHEMVEERRMNFDIF